MNTVQPSRRGVVRSAAWSLPAIAVATSAPAFAGSVPPVLPPVLPVLEYTVTNSAELQLNATNAGTEAVTIEVEIPHALPHGSRLAQLSSGSGWWINTSTGAKYLRGTVVQPGGRTSGLFGRWALATGVDSDVVTLTVRVDGFTVQTLVVPFPFV